MGEVEARVLGALADEINAEHRAGVLRGPGLPFARSPGPMPHASLAANALLCVHKTLIITRDRY
jgi:hypothetical protein